jgi:hypothetical protein
MLFRRFLGWFRFEADDDFPAVRGLDNFLLESRALQEAVYHGTVSTTLGEARRPWARTGLALCIGTG